MLKVQAENLYPFVIFLFFFYRLYTKFLFYWLFSSFSRHIKKTFISFIYLFINYSKNSSWLWFIAYVLCFNVSPLFERTYKYSDREYAHILTLRLNYAAFFKVICRFILESFLSNFSASLTYPEVALRSRYIFSSLFKLKYSSSSGNSVKIGLSI